MALSLMLTRGGEVRCVVERGEREAYLPEH